MLNSSTLTTRCATNWIVVCPLLSILHVTPPFLPVWSNPFLPPCRVGQLASSRGDILPPEVVEELSLLQDRVPGFGYPAAARIIEEELGAPVADLFAWFDTVPLAAASLSQVHRARLWGGEEVVVKVQRPRLAALFEIDLQALRGVAQYLQRSKKYGGSTRDWIGTFVLGDEGGGRGVLRGLGSREEVRCGGSTLLWLSARLAVGLCIIQAR